MSFWFYATCFFIGISASSTMGPIFVMTFNNSAIRGFLKGFFTALGAALGDGVLVLLGLLGTLAVLQKSSAYLIIIDLAGALLLMLYGIKLFMDKNEQVEALPISANTLILTAGRAFFSTIINPLTILFFMFAGAQILAAGSPEINAMDLVLGSALTSLGSLAVLAIVAYIASSMGKVMKADKLRLIGTITACVVLTVGAYFLFDAVKVVWFWWRGS